MKPETSPKLALSFGRRMALLFCCLIVGLAITSIVSMLALRLSHGAAAAIRITAVIQTLLVFIMPAIALALIITRRPDMFLLLDRKPRATELLIALATLVAATPAINWIVEWNAGLSLPESLAGLEQWMKAAETNADAAVKALMGGNSIGGLIISLLIVGVMAGLGEELFFRGALQRLLLTKPMNHHAAIWIAAAVFSLFHLQMYGFVPRMLLGAFFGYAAWWTRSLWVPIAIHIFNNSLVAIATWITDNNLSDIDFNALGADGTTTGTLTAVASAVIATSGLMTLRRLAKRSVSQIASDGK